MRTLIRSAALAASLLVVAGCAAVRDLAAAAFEKPKLTFQSVSVESFDLEGATLAFQYRLENPNRVGLNLAKLGYALDVEGTRVVDGQLNQGLRIPAAGTVPVTLPVHVKFKDVPGFVRLVTQRDAVKYTLSGNAGVSTPIGVVDLPLSHTATLALPRLPGFSLETVAIRSASLTDLALDVRLAVQNPNPFPVPAGQLAYGLSVGGTRIASADGAALGAVPAGGRAVVSLPVKLSLLGAGRAVYQLVQGNGPVPVALSGKATIAGIQIPLDLAGRVSGSR